MPSRPFPVFAARDCSAYLRLHGVDARMSSDGGSKLGVREPLLGAGRLLLPFVVLLAAAVGFFSLGHYDHDDHLNGVVPIVARDHRLYSDFAYDQTPLSVLVSVQISKLVGDRDLYTVLRLYSLLLNFSAAIVGMVLCWRSASNKTIAALLFAGLYLSFGPVDAIGGEIGNYTLALFLFSLSLLCFEILRNRDFSP
jgi:hypothetical protein